MKDDKEWFDIWNDRHHEYIKKGVEIRNELMADYCEALILQAKELYYSSGDPIMSDAYYDRLEMYLECLRPESEVLEKVGA